GKRISFASLARHDGLTGLPNRLALREWFDAHVGRGPRERAVAVHYLDLDGFKPVNDRYGHPIGDALLCAVAGRLAHSLRAGDIAARLGGDEFAIIQPDLGRVEEAELLAHRLSNAMKQPFSIGEHDIRISACIGTVTSTSRTDDLERLLTEADEALYVAKRGGHIVMRRSHNSMAA
ncbi:MAG: GGDEF domain-containing protein, partial [Rhodospirillaceae bacterium]|nr:GGDEF domain-containing protein [Rhodospirillaceae bacterium]